MRPAVLLTLTIVVALSFFTTATNAQQSIPINGDRLTGIVLPVEPIPGNIVLKAQRIWAWDVDDTKRLLLRGDVEVRIGAYDFRAANAVVWINRMPSAGGLINQIAVYFASVDDPTKRAGMGVQGNRVLITGSVRGEIQMTASSLDRSRPPSSDLLRRAEQRLAQYLRRLRVDPPALAQRPQWESAQELQDSRPRPGQPIPREVVDPPERVQLPPVASRTPPLFVPKSRIMFSWGRLDVTPGEDENVVTLTGSVTIEYLADRRQGEISQLTLSAERAVVFTDPGSIEEMATSEMSADSVRGIYLEGDVSVIAENGEYMMRAPKMYYDLATNQAIMLNSILRTYSDRSRAPIYVRAEEMRQIAENQWTGSKMRASTSEFFTPHLSIGSDRVTITRRKADEEEGDEEIHFDAQGNTLRMGNLPVLYWPQFSGTIDDIPLRGVQVGTSNNERFGFETTWDLFGLTGLEKPSGLEADVHLDAFEDAAAAGVDVTYDNTMGVGNLELYGMYDDGEDRTSSGRKVDQDEAFRGVALWEHMLRIDRNWSLALQGSYISDETFITSWREDDFTDRREYETSAYLKYQRDNRALTVLGKYDMDNFISNDYLLASQQYQVEKLPEVAWRQYGESWFNDRVNYSGETRISRMRMRFERNTPDELGVRGRAFGIPGDVPVGVKLSDEGLTSEFVNRFDSRHELTAPMEWGIIKAVPFVVGRFTSYSDDFDEFSSDADSPRLFGSAGLRMTTRFQRVHNGVESQLFDLHRVRHIVEPRIVAWYAYADVDRDDLPVYDLEVESLADGGILELAVRNTFQTQRGGPGRWRSVDFLTVDTAVVLTENESDTDSPTPQYFAYRPEYTQLGDHLQSSFVFLPSDHLSFLGEATYDLEEEEVARGSIGTELRHSPVLSTFVEYRYIAVDKNELLGVGWNYRLTPKYRVQFRPDWDFREDEFRSVRLRVTRSFPDFDFNVQVRYDQIRDDTTIGASLDLAEF